MRKPRCLGIVALVSSLGLCVTACGGDDGGNAGDDTPALGTCDFRNVQFTCLEMHDGSAADVSTQEEACVNANGQWSNDACPTEGLVGCCDYLLGYEYRECFYDGTTRDPVAYCTDMEGVWTPAA